MKISPSCYALTGFGYATPWCVNTGIVVGDNITLIVDTAANALAAATIYGYAQAIRGVNTLRVINTEKHFDHIGGNSFFRDRGIEIWGHAQLRRSQEQFAAEIQEFNDGIANRARRENNEADVFFGGVGLALPDHPIQQESSMDLGRVSVDFIMTPGHTNTNISIWASADGVLFSGDCMINGYLPNLDAGTTEDWETWLQSLDKIEALHPQHVVPGHGPVLFEKQVQTALNALRTTLTEAIKKGKSPTSY